jgi:hypothetical protein
MAQMNNGNAVPLPAFRLRPPRQTELNPPNPLAFLTGNAMAGMQGLGGAWSFNGGNQQGGGGSVQWNPAPSLGDIIGQGFGYANAQSSANRRASYEPQALMDIARINNDAENYRTNARLAAQLASMGMLGKIMGGFGNSLGGMFGGGGWGGGMNGFRATDSPQAAGFGPAGPGGGGGAGPRRPMPQMPYNVAISPTRQAMFMQRYGR